MQLKSILEEITKLQDKAQADIPQNPATIQGHISRRRAAELKIPEMKREYKSALLRHIVPIVVTGSTSSEFSKIASEELSVLTVDGESLFKELRTRMPAEATTGKMSTKVVMDVLARHFSDIASESDVLEYPQILYKNSRGFAINDESDLDKLIKLAINESVGAEMATIYNLKSISQKALEIGFNGEKSHLPVLMLVQDESIVDRILEGQRRLGLQSYLLTSGEISNSVTTKALTTVEKVAKESVMDALKAVKTNLKKRSK